MHPSLPPSAILHSATQYWGMDQLETNITQCFHHKKIFHITLHQRRPNRKAAECVIFVRLGYLLLTRLEAPSRVLLPSPCQLISILIWANQLICTVHRHSVSFFVLDLLLKNILGGHQEGGNSTHKYKKDYLYSTWKRPGFCNLDFGLWSWDFFNELLLQTRDDSGPTGPLTITKTLKTILW